MYEIKIEDHGTLGVLGRIAKATRNTTPLSRSISAELLSHTEANLEAEGRPKWLGLKPSTIAARTKRGTWPGKIMQVSGQLAASYVAGYDAQSAWAGSNKVQAAIQNLGGRTGRGHNTEIDPRPQLPIDAQGNLQPEAEEDVLGLANDYLANLIGR